MKAILENQVENVNTFKAKAFIEVLNAVMVSQDEDELRVNMAETITPDSYEDDYFEYGCGHNHLWVMDKESKKRVIFVEFPVD